VLLSFLHLTLFANNNRYFNYASTAWEDKLYKLIPTPDIEMNRTVDGIPNTLAMGECSYPEVRNKNDIWAIRGYTLTLYVEEMTDGINYWRQVHDCQVEVDEKPHQTTATAKADIYERIVFRDFGTRCKELGRCDEMGGSTLSVIWYVGSSERDCENQNEETWRGAKQRAIRGRGHQMEFLIFGRRTKRRNFVAKTASYGAMLCIWGRMRAWPSQCASYKGM